MYSGKLTYIAGNVPDYNWHDITEDCIGVDGIKLGEEVPSWLKTKRKGTTTQITIGFSAYQMILDYLLQQNVVLNYFDARITDTDLNYTFKLYEIKPDNIEFCSDAVVK